MYALDTNIVFELRKPKPHRGVVAWLPATADADLHLSAVNLDKIQLGLELNLTVATRKVADFIALHERVFSPFAPR